MNNRVSVGNGITGYISLLYTMGKFTTDVAPDSGTDTECLADESVVLYRVISYTCRHSEGFAYRLALA